MWDYKKRERREKKNEKMPTPRLVIDPSWFLSKEWRKISREKKLMYLTQSFILMMKRSQPFS